MEKSLMENFIFCAVCGINNNCLEELCFTLKNIFRLNKTDRLEAIEKHFHLKGYDAMNNPGRN